VNEIPKRLTLKERCQLSREHQFYEFSKDMLIILLLLAAMIFTGAVDSGAL
jgi:hypothetical protein